MADEQSRTDDVLDGDLELSADDAEAVKGGSSVTPAPSTTMPTKQASTVYSTTIKSEKAPPGTEPPRTIDRSAGIQRLSEIGRQRGTR
jgi:hypothetical protein